MGTLPGLCEPRMAVCRDNKGALGLAFSTAKEKTIGSHLESHRRLSAALWAAALKSEWPRRMMATLPL